MAALPAGVDCVAEADRAAELLRPLRLEILRLAQRPVSATELGSRLGVSRQRINYHLRRLASSGFLRRAGRRRRRNMIEQRYVVAARGFVLSPELLGSIGADWRRIEDAGSAAYLLALCAQMQSDLIRAWRGASKEGKRVSTLSLKSQFRFETPAQRDAFTRAIRDAVVDVIARHTSPNVRPDSRPAPGRPYRLVLGCYPYARQAEPKK